MLCLSLVGKGMWACLCKEIFTREWKQTSILHSEHLTEHSGGWMLISCGLAVGILVTVSSWLKVPSVSCPFWALLKLTPRVKQKLASSAFWISFQEQACVSLLGLGFFQAWSSRGVDCTGRFLLWQIYWSWETLYWKLLKFACVALLGSLWAYFSISSW